MVIAAAPTLDTLLQEDRRYPPVPNFAAQANWRDPAVYERASADPQAFWAEQSRHIDWMEPWHTVLEWNAPWARWFVGGRLNASYNCVDRHAQSNRRTKAAIVFESEAGEQRVLTYADLVSHPAVAESAVIGVSHEVKGRALAAFVVLRHGRDSTADLEAELKHHVANKLGAFTRPDKVFFAAELPKTRSAKIMRRLLRDIAEGKVLGDTTTLADPAVLAGIKQQYERAES